MGKEFSSCNNLSAEDGLERLFSFEDGLDDDEEGLSVSCLSLEDGFGSSSSVFSADEGRKVLSAEAGLEDLFSPDGGLEERFSLELGLEFAIFWAEPGLDEGLSVDVGEGDTIDSKKIKHEKDVLSLFFYKIFLTIFTFSEFFINTNGKLLDVTQLERQFD